ncbi:MAG TPA: DUF5683 domain-containing protein [Chryseosolibacter sp.]
MRRLGLMCLFIIAAFPALSQDSLKITRDTIFLEPEDTIMIKSYAKRYNPRKALLYAAVLPGLGQVYTKKYWKLPLVYGGIYLIGKNISDFNKVYVEYKNHLFYNLENRLPETQPNPNVSLTTPQLRRIVDKARRERDLWVICMGGMYLLQLVDAHVDAHLKEFDLNPNLKASIQPTMTNDVWVGRQTGVSLTFRF